jgi:hypothetical protein
MKYANGDIFVGTWVENCPHTGAFSYSNGEVHSGVFETYDNKSFEFVGQNGSIAYPNGDKYSGMVVNRLPHGGDGVMKYANGNVFYGGWRKGARCGVGVLSCEGVGEINGVWACGLLVV